MPNRRPETVLDRYDVAKSHDSVLARLPADHFAAQTLRSLLSPALTRWREARAVLAGHRGRWQTAVKKGRDAKAKNDAQLRWSYRMVQLKYGQEALRDLVSRAGNNNLSAMVKMPVDRLLVIQRDLFVSVDLAPTPPVWVEELLGLRESYATLRAASAEEHEARTTHRHAGGVERRATADLDLAATRVALVIEGVFGVEAGQYLPKFRKRGVRGPNTKTVAREG